jgi:F-type H+-transporting ATPase subunit delta
MANKQLAARYAKALISLAIERNELEVVYNDMSSFLQSCNESHEFKVFLKSPIIKADDKIAVLNKIYAGNVTTLSISFLSKVTKSTREAYLGDIAEEFIAQYKKHKNIITAHLSSSTPLSESFKSEITKEILSIPQDGKSYTVEFVEKINPNLIGGFILRVEDKQIDTSLARRVGLLKRKFNENLYIKAF